MSDVPPNSDPVANGGGGKDDQTELFIAVAALVLSVLAFVVSILQALQQYYSSARGYSSCGPTVIGKWAAFRHRRFLWSEFRFEVEFLTPVIFIARPSNTRGPMGSTAQSKITVLDGSEESYKGACVLGEEEKKKEDSRKMAEPGRVHTADNEAATWLDLLMAVQTMEVDSRRWQEKVLSRYEGGDHETEGSSVEWPPKVAGGHSLTVCIQRKKKSWDTLPENVTKPYATTTIAHMVELSAMLGIYWIVWNREDDRYLGQGNGFILSGSNVEGLGLTFAIQKKGPTIWGAHRLVPHYLVKELCFGFCPTTFRLPEEKSSAEESRGIGSLQFSSMEEIGETLVVLGLNARNVNYFRDTETKARYDHLFPITFEILGMLGVVFQIKGTVFRTLPNPTVFRWDPKSFDLLALLGEFRKALAGIKPAAGAQPFNISSHLDAVLVAFEEWKAMPEDSAPEKATSTPPAAATGADIEAQKGNSTVTQRRWPLPKTFSVMTAATLKTQGTTATQGGVDKPVPPRATYTPAIFSALHAAIEACDAHLNPLANREANSLLRVVLRAHIQAVLSMVNPTAAGINVTSSVTPATTEVAVDGAPTIEDLDAASDKKHELLMAMYFKRVRPEVLSKAHAKSTGSTQAAGDIWDALIFRMLCWLVLHHFHEKDVQIGHKSDVFESRMPVYVT
ncbi:hypothetical protein B0T14DRAFT_566413 [Immersiella caudata]|uniref:Modin n=1 Tax=Immersiella caudata TaxID=314043 RepID=A0AA39WQ87_9PEZI|nr:hypothetical protein B0T14DRAFT_566413 [Immersiella caudata]